VAEVEAGFSINVTGLLVATQEIVPKMIQRGSGSVLVTGATASLRGKPFTAGFAPVKGAQQLFMQSLARDVENKVTAARDRQLRRQASEDAAHATQEAADAAAKEASRTNSRLVHWIRTGRLR
jgi:short-subunit dehydrogenase